MARGKVSSPMSHPSGPTPTRKTGAYDYSQKQHEGFTKRQDQGPATISNRTCDQFPIGQTALTPPVGTAIYQPRKPLPKWGQQPPCWHKDDRGRPPRADDDD